MAVAVSIFGCKGARLVTAPNQWEVLQEAGVEIDRQTITFPLIRIEGGNAEFRQCLRPPFDALWNASGHPGCPNYDSDGNWVDSQQ